MWLYYDKMYVSQMYQAPKLFPTAESKNVCILVSGLGGAAATCLISHSPANLNCLHSGCQAFPIMLPGCDADSITSPLLPQDPVGHDNVSDFALKVFREAYGPKVGKEDIFYYVYGVLHSPEYRSRYAADLKKMLPRIPLTKEPRDFEAFEGAGRKLAEWHLNYDTVEPWPVREHSAALELDPDEHYRVQKMVFARPTTEQKAAGQKWDKSRIIYNSHITLTEIPIEAYGYVVNGKPAIEWIIERYQVTRDKASGIVNDPNDWCREHNQPRYIIDLVKRVVRVSIETMKIVRSLPPLNER